MIRHAAVIVAVLAAPAAAESTDAWTIALEMNASADRTRASTHHGTVTLRGAGAGIYTSASRRIRNSSWYAHGALTLRTVADLVQDADNAKQPLPDASLWFAGLGAGVAWQPASRWWISATVGPSLAAYVSPRALGLTSIGVALDVAAARSFGISRSWSIDIAARTSLAALPDGEQTLLAASLGLGVAARVGW